MKSAVVFYSYDGNTRVAAKVIADRTDAGIFELEEVKKRGRSALSFIAAGYSAALGRESAIKDTFSEKLKRYDRIYIGTPVWAGKPAPAVNAFINKAALSGKEIILFTVQADENPQASSSKCSEIMKSKLEEKGATVKNIMRLRGEAPGKTIKIEEMQKQLGAYF